MGDEQGRRCSRQQSARMEEESSLIEKTGEQMQHGSAPLSHQQKTGARLLAVALRFELLVRISAKQCSSSESGA